MAGATLESLLLRLCQYKIEHIKPILKKMRIERKIKISNNPLSWNLAQLLEISEASNILPLLKINENISISIFDIGEIIRKSRNLLHPGKHLKSLTNILEENNFKDIEAYYELINFVFKDLENGLKNEI